MNKHILTPDQTGLLPLVQSFSPQFYSEEIEYMQGFEKKDPDVRQFLENISLT